MDGGRGAWGETTGPGGMLSPDQRERYSRHLQLPEIGEAGQARLSAARVLVVGAGGLGSPAVMFLAGAGVGTLAIADYDRVELSNLQRQVLYRASDLGKDKVEAARSAVAAMNPDVRVEVIPWAMDGPELVREVEKADAVVDASDNFETRFEVNAACVAAGTPLVSGAAIRMRARSPVFDPNDPESPCYRCVFDDTAIRRSRARGSGYSPRWRASRGPSRPRRRSSSPPACRRA